MQNRKDLEKGEKKGTGLRNRTFGALQNVNARRGKESEGDSDGKQRILGERVGSRFLSPRN